MRCKECRHEEEPAARRRLRRDVAGAVEDAGCRTERSAGTERRHATGGRGGRDEPQRHRRPASVAARSRAGEGDGEEQQSGHRDDDAGTLRARQPLRDEEREDRDPAGGGRLHERERREPQRRDIEHPAADADDEADEPAPVGEQRPQGRDRPARGERRQGRGGAVLGDVAPVEGDRRRERQRQRDGDRHRWNGR